MSATISIFIGYFFVVLLLFAFCYLTGSFLFKLIKASSSSGFFNDFFLKTLTGSVVLACCISIFHSAFKTINIVFLLVILLWIFERFYIKKNVPGITPKEKSVFSLKNIAGLAFLIFVLYVWHATIVLQPGAFPVNHIEKDNYFYAEISKCLVFTGQENTFATANLVSEKYHYPTPYHYFDLWLNGAVCKLFGLNYSLALFLIVYTFFSALLLFGFLACIEMYTKVNNAAKVLSFFLLFISGLYVTERLMHIYTYNAQMEGMTERFGGKLSAVYCLALGVMLLFIRGNITSAILLLLCLPIVSISLAPGVYGGIAVYCLVRTFCKKSERLLFLRLFFYTILVSGCIGVFYYALYRNDLNYRLDKPINAYTDLTTFSFFRIKFFLVELFLKSYAHPLMFFLNYGPFALIAIYLFFKKTTDAGFKNLTILFVFIWFCSLMAFNSLYLMDDAFQLYINALVILHVFFGFSFIVFYFGKKEKTLFEKMLMILFISATIYNAGVAWHSYKELDNFDNQFSKKYVLEVNRACEKFKEPVKGCTFYDAKFYNNVLITYPLELYCTPLILSPYVYSPFNLTPPGITQKWNKYQLEKNILKSPFTQYLKDQSKSGSALDTIQCQTNFIKENNIRYFICPKQMDLSFLKQFGNSSVINDSLTGQRFVILND